MRLSNGTSKRLPEPRLPTPRSYCISEPTPTNTTMGVSGTHSRLFRQIRIHWPVGQSARAALCHLAVVSHILRRLRQNLGLVSSKSFVTTVTVDPVVDFPVVAVVIVFGLKLANCVRLFHVYYYLHAGRLGRSGEIGTACLCLQVRTSQFTWARNACRDAPLRAILSLSRRSLQCNAFTRQDRTARCDGAGVSCRHSHKKHSI